MRDARVLGFFVAVLAVSSAAWPAGQAQGGGRAAPAVQAGPQQPVVGTGFIAGQVVETPSGKPVPEATVTVLGRSAAAGPAGRGVPPPAPVIADAQGRFFFANLPPGVYTIQASRIGYVQPRVSGVFSSPLADGDRILDGRIRLTKVASISGTLRDEVGDPVVGTDVFVVRRTILNGRAAVQPVGKIRSDDRGQYRIGNLPSGDYVVCACSRDPIPIDSGLLATIGAEPLQLLTVATRALSGGSDVVSIDNTLRTYAPTFHPNSATFARATKITVAPGEDKTGIDVNLEPVRAARVSGTIVGATGPVQAQSMRLVPSGDGEITADLFSLPPLLVQPDGRFDFAMVPPGQYRLFVVHRAQTGRGGAGPSGAAMGLVGGRASGPQPAALLNGAPVEPPPPLWANEPITVGDRGLTGAVITLNRAPNVSGRVQWIGGAPQPPVQMLARAAIVIQPMGFGDPLMSALAGSVNGRIAPDASFTANGVVPGKYSISFTALPGFPTLKSVLVGGVDLTDMPLEVADKDLGDVVITYVDTPLAALTVTTNPATGSLPFDDAWAMVFPVDRKYWTEPSAARRRFRTVAMTTKGVAAVTDLPAGDYFVIVTTGFETQDWQEAAKLDALSKRSQKITVADGEKKTIEVRR